MFGSGELDRASFLAARRKAEAIRDAARATVTKDRRETVLDGLDTTTIRKLWPELPEERQRAILAAVLDRIEVDRPPRGGHGSTSNGYIGSGGSDAHEAPKGGVSGIDGGVSDLLV